MVCDKMEKIVTAASFVSSTPHVGQCFMANWTRSGESWQNIGHKIYFVGIFQASHAGNREC